MKRMTLHWQWRLVLGATTLVAIAQRRPLRRPTRRARLPLRRPRPPSSAAPAAAPAPASKIDTGDTAWMLTSSLARPHDDRARARALLRRHGAEEERPRHAHAELHHRWRSSASSGCSGATRSRSGPTRAGSSAAWTGSGSTGVGARAHRRLCGDHPAPGLHDLPDDVRHHHAGAHHRRVRGADEVLGVPASSPSLWATLVYDPAGALGVGRRRLAAQTSGALDFAGGTVVHISSGVSALRLRARDRQAARATGSEPMPPHNLTMTVIGAALLWFGWFGFNAGSALGAERPRRERLRRHQHRRGAGGARWMFIEWMHAASRPCSAPRRAPSPDSSPSRRPRASSRRWPPLSSALVAGVALLLGRACSRPSSATTTRSTSSACTASAGPGAPCDGALRDQGRQRRRRQWPLLRQPGPALRADRGGGGGHALAISVTIVILKIVDVVVGLRVSAEDEMAGLDLSQHSETAYSAGGGFGEFGAASRPAWASPCAPPRASPGWRIEPARRTGLDSPLG